VSSTVTDDLEDPEAEAPAKGKAKKGHAECPDCGAFVQLVKCGLTEDGSSLNYGKSERVCMACAFQRIFRSADRRAARRAQ
jgi:hypothetical protein